MTTPPINTPRPGGEKYRQKIRYLFFVRKLALRDVRVMGGLDSVLQSGVPSETAAISTVRLRLSSIEGGVFPRSKVRFDHEVYFGLFSQDLSHFREV